MWHRCAPHVIVERLEIVVVLVHKKSRRFLHIVIAPFSTRIFTLNFVFNQKGLIKALEPKIKLYAIVGFKSRQGVGG